MLSHSVVSDSLRPHGPYSPWNSPGQNTGVGSLSLLQGIFPIQGSNPGLLHCRQISSPSERQGKPKNTGVGSLFLLQRIFLTQELYWGLLHCRQILYQLSYEGSPLLDVNSAQMTNESLQNTQSGIDSLHITIGASLVAQMAKSLLAVQETWVQSLGQEDPLEKEMATHSCILAWKIPSTDELGGI